MFILKLRSSFDAAHFLRGYEGKCKNVHGHRFEIEVVVKSEKLNEIGMVIDFGILKRIVKQVTSSYDHKLLNELQEFQKENPTAENLAQVIYRQIKYILINEKFSDVTLKEVTVWESPDASATYCE